MNFSYHGPAANQTRHRNRNRQGRQMFVPIISGFALGFSLIMAIGAQNAFVLRQGLKREYVFAVAMICATSDTILILTGVFGLSSLKAVLPPVAAIMTWGGAAFLFFYGVKSFVSSWRGGGSLTAGAGHGARLWPVVATCLAMTWLNPHVYLDTVLLVGSTASRFPGQEGLFGLGASMASFTFFFSLAYGARFLAPLFASPTAWRVLDAVIGVIMWTIAAGLVRGALSSAAT